MEKIIKIVKSSIKKNPNANGESITTLGAMEVRVKYKGTVPPDVMDNVLIIESSHPLDREAEFVFVPKGDHQKIIDRFIIDPKASINVNQHYIDFSCKPGPKYLYNYENKGFKCEICKSIIKLNNIKSDYDYDENHYYECPVCSSRDSFRLDEYRWETIDEALNR